MTSQWQTLNRFSIAGAIDDPVNGQPMMRIENRLILVAELLFANCQVSGTWQVRSHEVGRSV